MSLASVPASVPAFATQRLLTAVSEELDALDAQGLLRELTPVEAVDGPRVRVQGRDVIWWCSNDYLGLSQDPRLAAAAAEAASRWGVGARASRLLGGTTTCHEQLEEALAQWFDAETALVYASGYLANLGVLGALLTSRDAVMVDRLAHASLVDAARSTRASLRPFRHNDPSHAASLLARVRGARRRVIVTEGVFSMDGDAAPLAELLDVAEAHDALLYVDDAHGAFVLGPRGRGAPEVAGLAHERFLYMGTLGKALGCQGGFVIGPRRLIELLCNRSRPFIYTTALAVPVVAAALEALRVVEREGRERRIRLQERTRSLHEQLADAVGALTTRSTVLPLERPSHIVPVVVGETERAVGLSEHLWERGIWAPAIRPPTVPRGTARLRLSVTALHTDAHIDALVAALRELERLIH